MIEWLLGFGLLVLSTVLFSWYRALLSTGERVQEIIDDENLSERVHVTSTPPVSRIARAVNRLLAYANDEIIAEHRRTQASRRLIADISHDLRTPLTSILGYTRAIREGRADNTDEALAVVEAKARGLHELIEQLFYLTRLEAEEFALDKKPVDLAEIIRRTVGIYYPDFEERGLEVRLDLPAAGAELVLDRAAMERILQNLLGNVLEHARGATHVCVILEVDEDQVTLVIADDGPGLEAADPEELLERTTSDYSGRGLGLPLVARLTAVHNGEVSLESLPGGGTRVELSLPAAGQRAPDLS